MKTVGIIAEFNPLHNGHAYIIEQAKKISGADYCVAVMSGNFVQRGTPAVCDKYARAHMALECGADAVFELPVAYSTATAEVFAEAGIKLLMTLGCVDCIVFGSECGNIEKLTNIASLLLEEPEDYRTALFENLRAGMPFPAAREAAFLTMTGNSSLSALLKEPNNILGIEYCKAALRMGNKAPQLITVKRIGSKYHEAFLASIKDDNPTDRAYPSATAMRNEMERGNSSDFLNDFEGLMPLPAFKILSSVYGISCPITAADLNSMLFIRLSTMSDEELSDTMGIDRDLFNVLTKHKNEPCTFAELVDIVKTKNITYTAVSRALLHVVLGIGRNFAEELRKSASLPYARLLGFKESSSALLRCISDNPDCNLITKLADADRDIPLLKADLSAAACYSQLVYSRYGKKLPSEYEAGVIRV